MKYKPCLMSVSSKKRELRSLVFADFNIKGKSDQLLLEACITFAQYKKMIIHTSTLGYPGYCIITHNVKGAGLIPSIVIPQWQYSVSLSVKDSLSSWTVNNYAKSCD